MTAEEMIAVGYCCISRRYRHVSRIDRPDWQDAMKPIFPDSDYYRRCCSKDVFVVSANDIKKFPGSNGGPDVYIPKGEGK